MSTKQKISLAIGIIFILLLIAAVAIPNLMHPRIAANERSASSRFRDAAMSTSGSNVAREARGGLPERASALVTAPEAAPDSIPEKKLIHNAELGMIVADVRAAAEQIQKLTEASHGEIDKLEIAESNGNAPSATIEVRVPATGLTDAIAEFKKVALRTEREEISARDVTREFYDNEAHLRNLHAEEQQYLAILKQAHSVQDALDASEKLSDVRDRIERLQAEIQVMTHDIDMSVVTIVLMQESETRVFGVHWRPLYQAKIALHEMLAGLGDWLDTVAALIIKLPLIVLWIVTVIVILLLCWKIIRFVWTRFVKQPKGDSQ